MKVIQKDNLKHGQSEQKANLFCAQKVLFSEKEMGMNRKMTILHVSVNSLESRRSFCESKIATNASGTNKRKRAFDEDWRKTKRIKIELQQVDLFIKQIDDPCKEGISEPKVPDNKSIDDLIADIDTTTSKAQIL